MIDIKIGGIIAAAFIAGAFVASPELRAYAANTVFSTDIVDGQVKTADLGNNSVTSAKIADGTITAADLATDSVGSSEIIPNSVGAVELKEVSKLLFSECTVTVNTPIAAGGSIGPACLISGLDLDDRVIAVLNKSNNPSAIACIDTASAYSRGEEGVEMILRNECSVAVTLGTATIGVMVYDK